MEVNLTVEETADCIALNIVGVAGDQRDLAKARLDELSPILTEILAFDATVNGLGKADFEARKNACLAMDMKYQIYLDALVKLVGAARQIADGSEDIAHYGFPEFSDA